MAYGAPCGKCGHPESSHSIPLTLVEGGGEVRVNGHEYLLKDCPGFVLASEGLAWIKRMYPEHVAEIDLGD